MDTDALAEKNKEAFNQAKYTEYERPKIKRPSMVSILNRIKPYTHMEDFKKIFMKKIRIITGPLMMKEAPGEPTLQDALIYLGQAHARLVVLDELQGMLQHVLCSNLPVWPQELWDLRELSKKQEATCTEMVKAFLFKADKDQQEVDKLPTIKDIDWKG